MTAENIPRKECAMSCENNNPEGIVNLNEYFKALEKTYQDIILLIVAYGEELGHLRKIDFGPYADDLIENLESEEDFAAIIDKSEKKIIWKRGKEATVDYEHNGCSFGAHSGESLNGSNRKGACFTIDRKELRLENNGKMNFLLFSKSENLILDLFSVDVRADPPLIIKEAYKGIFNLERELALNGTYEAIALSREDENKEPNGATKLARRVARHIREVLEDPKNIVPYLKARIASFHTNGKNLEPDYSVALKWMNSAINSSNVYDGELTDSESVYYGVNQFLSKRESHTTRSEKELCFLNMSPAGGELRLLQMSEAILLKKLNEICEESGVEYWVIAGTLLGAVRHGGFIPWDDDIDVGMLRSDICKLEKTVKEKYPGIRLEKGVWTDKREAYRHYKIAFEGQESIFIDIFPFDIYDTPVDQLEEKLRSDKKKICVYVDQYKRKNNIGEIGPFNDEQRANVEKILSAFSGNEEPLSVKDGKSIGYGADTLMPFITKLNAYDIKTIFPCKSALFENVKIKIPSDPHLFLEGYFGDYYTIPFNAFLKKHTDLSDTDVCDIKERISEYSQYILGSDADAS